MTIKSETPMPPLKCLIVDDELGAAEGIKFYIEKLDFLEVTQIGFSAIEATRALREHEIDLMFLDINMPELSGIELLESLKKTPLTIMTTAYSEYALDGFRLNVVDYLLKPISFPRFFQAVQKAHEMYRSQLALRDMMTTRDQDIYIKQGDTFIRFVWTDILYIEAMQNYVKIYLKDKVYLVHQTMHVTANMLPDKAFFRIHKSFLVNLSHIEKISGGRVYVNGTELPLSKYRREELFKTVVSRKLLSR
ncbi:LytR/AlgR family response regulator transcription factor [Sphingobacterium puteale]|nr:LytTR family DNA-binding domain-containing protein [Sphingobacterium puteale]